MPSHKRRPLPNWVAQDLDEIKMAAEAATRELERLLTRLERGDTQAAAFPVARISQELATISKTATLARNANKEAS